MRRATRLLGALVCLLPLSLVVPWADAAPATDGTAPPTAVRAATAKLPLHFERNQGQTAEPVRFLARGPRYTLFLTPTAAVLRIAEGQAEGTAEQGGGRTSPATPRRSSTVRLELLGAKPSPDIVGLDALPGKTHYLRGSDPAGWQTDVPLYARVQYRQVYPGVDLVYYGKEGQVEHDFLVAPGADPRRIAFTVQGARKVRLDPAGDLVLHLPGGELRLRKPLAYQEVDGVKQPRRVRYALDAGRHRGTARVGFRLGPYDRTRPLVIDPVLLYATYLGGSNWDTGFAIAVDAAGSAYVTGRTSSPDFPTETPFQADHGGNSDAFVAKLNPAGSALVYATYLGGSGWDTGTGIAVDAAGNAYVTGGTSSPNFPLMSPLQGGYGGGLYDVFVAKLTSTGAGLVYATYLGGSGTDFGQGIAVDGDGNAHVVGLTGSTNFPTAAPLQPAFGGYYDSFIAKLNAAGSALVYATYLGGSDWDEGYAIAVDAAGNAYVTGETSSGNFPRASPLQPASGGSDDAFVAKLNAAGSALVYATYLGGSSRDLGCGIAADAAGNAYVTGLTWSANFPTASPFQPAYGGGGDAFVAKLNAAGSALVYATYLGGSHADMGRGIAVDAAGHAYVTGETWSSNLGDSIDAFVAKVNAAGSALVYATSLGGSGADYGSGIAVDGAGSVYVSGTTESPDFPTAYPLQYAFGGDHDVFVAKLTARPPIAAPSSRRQAQANGTTLIPVGGWATASTVVFAGTVRDVDLGQPVRLQVEVQPVGIDFTGAASCESAFLDSGTAATCAVSGLTVGTSYHWQARAVDSVGTASAWAAFGGNAETAADFTVNTRPSIPVNRGQRQPDGITPIPLGGMTASSTVVFRATVTDPDAGQKLRLQVEVQPVGAAFTGVVRCQSALVISGTAASCSANGLTPRTSYHWRARTMDSAGAASNWVSYATNAEDAADFVVNTRPAVPMSRFQRQANGTTPIKLGGTATSPTVVLGATVSDVDAGQLVRVQVEVKPVGTPFDGAVSCQSVVVASGTAAHCSVTGLTTGRAYHWRVRAMDSKGGVSAWASYATNAETAADFRVGNATTSGAPPSAIW